MSADIFLLLCWVVALLSLLCLGALVTDVILPWYRHRRQLKRLAYLQTTSDWPNWLKRQAD